jgi:hypothetical protein
MICEWATDASAPATRQDVGMLRTIFTVASGASVLLCMVAVALWIQGDVADAIDRPATDVYGDFCGDDWIESNNGLLSFVRLRLDAPERLKDQLEVAIRHTHLGRRIPSTIHRVGPPTATGRQEFRFSQYHIRLLVPLGGIYHAYRGGGWLSDQQCTIQFVSMPDYFVVLVMSVLPVLWINAKLRASYRNRVARRHQKCQTCGYDVRASTDQCPECGTVIPPPRDNETGTGAINK